jgi:hypothetical protein
MNLFNHRGSISLRIPSFSIPFGPSQQNYLGLRTTLVVDWNNIWNAGTISTSILLLTFDMKSI